MIKNIIFDWGGVITNLCYERCRKAFLNLSVKNFSKTYIELLKNSVFLEFELGKINDNQFRDFIRSNSIYHLTDEEIDTAWYQMLDETPPERIELLKKLKQKFNIVLMSNTNKIHVEKYSKYLKETYGLNGFEDIFHKVYYSHIIGMRKPDIKFFNLILKENNFLPEETLFVDDIFQNIESAKAIGIHSILVTRDNPIEKIFSNA